MRAGRGAGGRRSHQLVDRAGITVALAAGLAGRCGITGFLGLYLAVAARRDTIAVGLASAPRRAAAVASSTCGDADVRADPGAAFGRPVSEVERARIAVGTGGGTRARVTGGDSAIAGLRKLKDAVAAAGGAVGVVGGIAARSATAISVHARGYGLPNAARVAGRGGVAFPGGAGFGRRAGGRA